MNYLNAWIHQSHDIFRARVGRPTSRSTVLPHRLYALVDDYQFRMAGAFSSDTTFVL